MNTVLALLAAAQLTTVAEQSGWKETGRYEEVIRLCTAFAEAYPGKVKCITFGTTPERRPMMALIASADGVLDAASAKEKARPVVLIQGGIHAGEIDGKDAGFLVLRELLEGQVLKGALSKVTLLFVPVFNVDGHERFGPNNRPNQRGPEAMGWRVTAGNLNLNRDYAKADAPEMRFMLSLLAEWDPIVYEDLHVTDGAKFQHDVSFLVEPILTGPETLRPEARSFRDGVIARLKGQKHLPLGDFYPSFNDDTDPASGFSIYIAPPRFSTAYWALHNRIGVLVETHSWKDYATRVKATHDCVVDTLELAARDGARWLKVAAATDEAETKLAGKEVGLLFDKTDHVRTIDFLGYAYTRVKSDLSGQFWVQYDESKPQVWKVPFHDEVKPVLSVKAPGAGYLVPAGVAGPIAERLKAHALEFTVLAEGRPKLPVEAWRASEWTFAEKSFEGHQGLTAKGAWAAESREVPAGSLFVPITQAKARLVMQLLEPGAPDGFLAWGFFNPFFEQKEFLESYLLEDFAARELADPALKAAYQKKLAEDPGFAKSPEARLRFFNQRHPSWDERYGLYPVYRVATPP